MKSRKVLGALFLDSNKLESLEKNEYILKYIWLTKLNQEYKKM